MTNNKTWPVVLLISLCLALGAVNIGYSVYGTSHNNVSTQLNLSDVKSTVHDAVSNVSVQGTVSLDSNATDLLNKISNEVTKVDDQKAEALVTVQSELNSRDFKRTVMNVLNNNSQNVVKYQDIKDVVILNSGKSNEVSMDGDTATVDLQLKVSYFNDEDTQAADLQYAKVDVTFEVDNLNVNDKYVDASVADYSANDMTFVKVYSY